MATVKPRLNITMPIEIANVLCDTAKRNKQSVSSTALDLIKWAIEEKEDIYFSGAADEVLHSNPKFIPNNDDIWE